MDGSGVFTTKPSGRGTIFGYFCGSLMYEDVCRRQQATKTFSAHTRAMTQDLLKKWANPLPETVIDRSQVEHRVWILPTPFCAKQYISDERYLMGHGASENERSAAVRQNNVKFYQRTSLDWPSGSQTHSILSIRAIKDIEYGEELYVVYGISYRFQSNKCKNTIVSIISLFNSSAGLKKLYVLREH